MIKDYDNKMMRYNFIQLSIALLCAYLSGGTTGTAFCSWVWACTLRLLQMPGGPAALSKACKLFQWDLWGCSWQTPVLRSGVFVEDLNVSCLLF